VAKKKHIARLNRCVDAWNEWQSAKQVMQPELSYALEGANLSFADSESANLSFAKLESARHANLRDAALVHAAMSLHGVLSLESAPPSTTGPRRATPLLLFNVLRDIPGRQAQHKVARRSVDHPRAILSASASVRR
jgi:hypothetical protein